MDIWAFWNSKSTKINFLGPETAGWGGGLPREGVVVEKFVPGGNLGCPGNLPRCPGPLGVFKKFANVCAKRKFVRIFVPYKKKTGPQKTGPGSPLVS